MKKSLQYNIDHFLQVVETKYKEIIKHKFWKINLIILVQYRSNPT